jgi:peptide/nickel transport system substrate-binding protein
MRVTVWSAAAAVAAVAVAAGCGAARQSLSTTTAAAPAVTQLSATTPAAAGPIDHITWALYREVNSLDPAFAFDYPENTVLTTLCDALYRAEPDGSIGPGLAESTATPSPTTMVLTLRRGVTFWNGSPLTAADVVYSLTRHTSARLGGFYGSVFDRVRSITATGPLQVTITLKEPDEWLRNELSSMAGIVVSRRYVEQKGKAFGTPAGGTMCTGPFELESWKTGDVLSVVRNDRYWDAAGEPKVRQIDFKGVSDTAALTSGLLTGEIDGTYGAALPTLTQLQQSSKVHVYLGPSYASDVLIVSSLKGVLGDVRVRRALSLAIDRAGYIKTIYKGAAQLPRALANPGTWGYGHDVFQAAWSKLPAPVVDLAQAKALVRAAGATGKTLVLGTSGEIQSVSTEATAVASAAKTIGLTVKLRSVSAQSYIDFFVDPKARVGLDGFFSINYPDSADPSGLYGTYALANGSQNYSGWTSPQVTRLFDEARAATDPDTRATLVVQAQAILMRQLPWIAIAAPDTELVMGSRITGAPASFVYMSGQWATALGAAR